jgi:hypothetical protein
MTTQTPAAKAAKARYYAKNKDAVIARRMARYETNKADELAGMVAYRGVNRCAVNAQKRVHRVANLERIREAGREYVKANKAAEHARAAAWVVANPERAKAIKHKYLKANPEIGALLAARRRAAKIKATPEWADHAAIKAVYALRADVEGLTGIPHHVDHIVPLRGKRVSGLHVHNNLQVIPATENLKKNNRFTV